MIKQLIFGAWDPKREPEEGEETPLPAVAFTLLWTAMNDPRVPAGDKKARRRAEEVLTAMKALRKNGMLKAEGGELLLPDDTFELLSETFEDWATKLSPRALSADLNRVTKFLEGAKDVKVAALKSDDPAPN